MCSCPEYAAQQCSCCCGSLYVFACCFGGFVSYVHVYPSPFLSSGGLSVRGFYQIKPTLNCLTHLDVLHENHCLRGYWGGCRKHTGFNLISTDFSLRCTLCTHIWGWTEMLQRNKFYSLGSLYSQIGANVSLKRQSSSVCRRG